ncbi:hypothetical protein E0H26_11705 [Micromonospora zingiberis]|uniref:Uncharacterized protein n=1 Tax=Micromonospora zingiberis TaxID=2053011 RepID=A0A4R0GL45_9ACTN|nr:hypothetical protein [Micromonospora zingiberis]TCB97577.1 hypothetical protein E0H26_11705 [Micromonospora zingiberis]
MQRYKITAPVKTATGTVAGVALVDGQGETDNEGALAYFRRHGYKVEEIAELPAPAIEPAPEPDGGTPEGQGPALADPPSRSASKAAWVTYVTSEAGGNRFSVEDAEKLTRDQLAEKYLGPKED